MSKSITSEDLLRLMLEETNNQPTKLDDLALERIATRINFEYVNGFNPSYQHLKRGSEYEVVARGLLQNASGHIFVEGDELVAYRGEGGEAWFRFGPEFDDGRFKKKT